jgi:YggT family protein
MCRAPAIPLEPLMTLALITLIDLVVRVYFWIVLARVVLSWLIGFNVVNQFNPAVQAVQRFCYAATEPLLRPIRRLMPDLGGLDISPIVLLLGVELVRVLLVRLLAGSLV